MLDPVRRDKTWELMSRYRGDENSCEHHSANLQVQHFPYISSACCVWIMLKLHLTSLQKDTLFD